MSSDTPIQASCIAKPLIGSWLTNGHLEVCFLKLTTPTDSQMLNDESRTENIAILRKFLTKNEETEVSILQPEVPNKPVLVLAPELAFGSQDYEIVDTIIKQYPQNIIFICGFGFSSGASLTAIVSKDNVDGIWESPLNYQKKYNGGWIWVKEGDNLNCYVFLKNFSEQVGELSIANLGVGDQILRLEGDDLIIFPTICADLISKEAGSPRERIAASLANDSSSNKKTLITGSLLNQNSSSGWWKSAIGDLLDSTKDSAPRLLLSNCENPSPVQDEEVDKWRCLTGAYQHLEGSKSPKKPLPNIRYVNDTKFSGLLIRNPVIGCIFGKLNWSNNPAEGLYVLSPGCQYIWAENDLKLCDGECAADELYRFICRHKGSVYDDLINLNDCAKTLAETQLCNLIEQLSPGSSSSLRKEAGLLFLKCLKGIDKNAKFSLESLHTEKTSLDCSLTTLALIHHALEAELMPVGKELDQGQILSSDGEREILVWDSSEHTAKRLYDMVSETVVKDGGSARPLTIIGRGNGGGTPPPDGRVRSTRLADITSASPLSESTKTSERDICEASDRVVYWKNQGEIDEVLMSVNPDQNLEVELESKISSVEEL